MFKSLRQIVKICYIKGHNTFEYNNQVGSLTKEAIKDILLNFLLNRKEINNAIRPSVMQVLSMKF